MRDSLRLAGIRGEVEIHVRKMSPMTRDERHDYLEALIGPKTGSASEMDLRALLVTRLNELGLWPPRGSR